MARYDRRTALRALASGAAAAASSTWVESLSALAVQQAQSPAAQTALAAQNWTPRVLDAHQNDTVVALTELIIPQTDTPGAKAAGVNRFIDAVLQAAEVGDRDAFVRGLAWLDDRSRRQFGRDFVSSPAVHQAELLTELSRVDDVPGDLRTGADFFRAIKSMTIDGYYTTEVGLRQELGDNAPLFLAQFPGCDHQEHQG